MIPRLPTFEIDLLRAFLMVQQAGSFSQAAHLLQCTQPAVSLQIKRLEQRAGVRLLDRQRGGQVKLTVLGQTLAGYARQIVGLHDEALSQVAKPRRRSRLRLGILEELGHARLPVVLRAFTAAFEGTVPHVQVGLSNQLTAAVLQGRLDMAVVAGEPGLGPGLPLWSEPLVWVASSHVPSLFTQPLRLVLLPEPCFYRRAALDALSTALLAWTEACSSSTMAGVRASVAAGLGIAVMGHSEVTQGLRVIAGKGDLPALPAADIMIFHCHRTLEAAARSLAGHIHQAAG